MDTQDQPLSATRLFSQNWVKRSMPSLTTFKLWLSCPAYPPLCLSLHNCLCKPRMHQKCYHFHFKWVSKVASFWDEEDKVNVYRSDKNMTDLYNQYTKDSRYVVFSMIAASLSSLLLPTHLYAALSRVDQVYIHVSGSYTTMDISCAYSSKDKCKHCKPKPQWILDSSALMHFSPERDDFAEYITFPKKDHVLVHTATGNINVIGISKCIIP